MAAGVVEKSFKTVVQQKFKVMQKLLMTFRDTAYIYKMILFRTNVKSIF